MNCAMARSSLASLPFSTTKRAPDILLAAAKSISPVASPSATWSLGAKAKLRWLPTRRISTLPVSSVPSGTSSNGRLGSTSRRRVSSASSSAASGLALLQRLLERRDLGHQRIGRLALALGNADLLAERLAPALDALALRDRRAPALVDLEQLGRQRRQVALLEAGIEGGGVLADESYVVHG